MTLSFQRAPCREKLETHPVVVSGCQVEKNQRLGVQSEASYGGSPASPSAMRGAAGRCLEVSAEAQGSNRCRAFSESSLKGAEEPVVGCKVKHGVPSRGPQWTTNAWPESSRGDIRG